MPPAPISDAEIKTICPIPPKEYTLEQLKTEMEHILGFLQAFTIGKSYYWQDTEEKRENLLCVAYYWAQEVLELRYNVKDNFDFAMRLVSCHTKNQTGIKEAESSA